VKNNTKATKMPRNDSLRRSVAAETAKRAAAANSARTLDPRSIK
jgi:hypothetical protein